MNSQIIEALRVLTSGATVAMPTPPPMVHVDIETPNFKLRNMGMGILSNNTEGVDSGTTEKSELQNLILPYNNRSRSRTSRSNKS